MLTHANAISVAETFMAEEDVRPTDEYLAYLPMAWAGDATYTLFASLAAGFTVSCPESVETVQRDLRELGPTALLAPPRIWENMLSGLQIKAADATPLKRTTYEFFRNLAERAGERQRSGERVPPMMRLGLAVGEFLVYGPVRDQLGLGRARWAYSGGGPLGADAYRFFRSFRINLKQIYGATELSGLASLQADGEADPDTVGRVCPGTQV